MKRNFKTHIILFDGVCNLCNRWIQRIIRWDKKRYFYFASLQSEAGQEVCLYYNIAQNTSPKHPYSSVILIENGKVFTKSSAVLRILKKLSGCWPLAYSLICVPKFIRDFVYQIIAENRYRWFGKKKECMIPTPALKERFKVTSE